MDDRSRTVFHTINNRYRRPVVNPELSSRGAGRRREIGEQERKLRAVIERPGSNWKSPPCLRVYLARILLDSDYRPLSRFRERKGIQPGAIPINSIPWISP
ncbi:unnamed protein product [Lasius platythorax]|uniref:Ribosomal protein S14 n=1 Tax=Lasius platythorax TaxID=488582 RepID=A0AAV2PFH2_9HYME